MKISTKYTLIAAFTVLGSVFSACETDFPNPNNPTEDVVLETKEGLYALAIGLRQYYSTTVLRQVIEAPGITTRELGVSNTFQNIIDLVRGGTQLPNDSGGITNPWTYLLKAKGMAESLIEGANTVGLAENTRASIIAYANLYKAMTLGALIQAYEQAPINNSLSGQAEFNDRATVLGECIRLLEEARDGLNSYGLADEFSTRVISDQMNLSKSINAFLSRYSLLAGNYELAISAADAVINDTSSPISSMWVYDAINVNPIWNRTVNSNDLDPRVNFGLSDDYLPEAGDGRLDFYLGAIGDTAVAEAGGHLLSEMKGFFSSNTAPIPVYLPGEMLLNKAEAYARNNNLPNAVIQLNLVRTKTDDPLGVNAELTDWTGNAADQEAVLEEIYKNRCIEMFLTGMRFEDSRRFHPNYGVPIAASTDTERNRNYYPYPYIERINNSNTPDDPEI